MGACHAGNPVLVAAGRCYKSDKQITKNETKTHAGDTRFNVENPFQHIRKKNHGRQLAKLHYI
jgi:hypothetical protein